jgi:hypothetical protein
VESHPTETSDLPDTASTKAPGPEPDACWAIELNAIIGLALARLPVVYWAPLQTVFRAEPLDVGQLGVIVAAGSTVILGGERDKAGQRKRGREG